MRDYERLVVLAVALIPTYLLRFSLFGIPTNVFEVTVGLVFVGGLMQSPVRISWKRALQSVPRSWTPFAMLFVVAALISTAHSDQVLVSLGILKGWILAPLLLAWLVYATNAKVFTTALILSGVVTSLLSLLYYAPGERLAGIYDVPNSLALWLAPLCVLALWLWLQTRRTWYGIAALLFIVTLLLTQSVAGLGAVVLAFVTAVAVHHRELPFTSTSWRSRSLIATLALVLLSLPLLSQRFSYFSQPIHETSLGVRLQLWSVGFELVGEHPIWGVGLGQFEPSYQRKLHERFWAYNEARQHGGRTPAAPLPEFVFRDPHNWLLSFWLNTGLLGLVSFTGLHVVVLRNYVRNYERRNLESQAVVLALVALLVFGLVDTIYWKNDLAALHWVLLALVTSMSWQQPRSYSANQQHSLPV